jgi:hypothetical protein
VSPSQAVIEVRRLRRSAFPFSPMRLSRSARGKSHADGCAITRAGVPMPPTSVTPPDGTIVTHPIARPATPGTPRATRARPPHPPQH